MGDAPSGQMPCQLRVNVSHAHRLLQVWTVPLKFVCGPCLGLCCFGCGCGRGGCGIELLFVSKTIIMCLCLWLWRVLFFVTHQKLVKTALHEREWVTEAVSGQWARSSLADGTLDKVFQGLPHWHCRRDEEQRNENVRAKALHGSLDSQSTTEVNKSCSN